MRLRQNAWAATFVAATTFLLCSPPALADYLTPPQALLKVLKAPPPPTPSLDPTGQRLLLTTSQTYPSITRVAQPYLKLAGVRLEPRNRSRHDTPGGYGIPACATDLTLVDVASGKETRVPLPKDACPGTALWSPDGQRFAFQDAAADSVRLWLGDAATGQIRQIPEVRLNPMFGNAVQWLDGGNRLLVKLVPSAQGPAPSDHGTASGPDVQESLGAKGESSTYETRDTLASESDERLFAYYAQSQLAMVDAGSGKVRKVGAPQLFNDVNGAPDGTC